MSALSLLIRWQRWSMNVLAALLSGVLFGIGLLVSGMSNPAKVIGFLDVAGLWDPSLALVMAGAIGVAVLPFAWARRLAHRGEVSWFGTPLVLPAREAIDFRLLFGSALFGIGWGLSGICPGPALVSFGSGYLPGIVFAVGMLLGLVAGGRIPEGHGSVGPAENPIPPAILGLS